MIDLLTSCDECLHSKTCKYKGNAVSDMKKLQATTYGPGSNDDYDWELMSNHRNVNISFSCPDFCKKGVTFR